MSWPGQGGASDAVEGLWDADIPGPRVWWDAQCPRSAVQEYTGRK
jgi:hypothetical protein